jgi:hypothetical protein
MILFLIQNGLCKIESPQRAATFLKHEELFEKERPSKMEGEEGLQEPEPEIDIGTDPF